MGDEPHVSGRHNRSPDSAVTVADAMLLVDWARTSVGDPSGWPAALQTMASVVLGSKFSMWMGWGPDLAFFYNDAYAADTLDTKHPWALGRPASQVWEEIWDDIEPRIDHVLATGGATWDENLMLFLERSGFREETYHTFSYSPLYDAGSVVGMLCVVSETTEEVIGDRRMATMRDLGAALSVCTTEAEVGAAVSDCLHANPCDVPFSLVYLVDGTGDAHLVAASGVSAGQDVAPELIAGIADAPWAMPDTPILIDALDRHFRDLPTGSWDAPPRQALLVPISEPGQEHPAGFFVVGLNPFRPVDLGYRGFVDLVAGQIAAAVSSARALEAERRRSEALAALDQAKTTFFTNISHEFRTPLTLLLAPIEDALAAPLDAENRDRLTLAHRNALRLLKLVNALLDFSRLEAGRLRASLEPLDLAAETVDVAGMFRSAIESGGVELVVDCPPLSRPALADRDMWELIVTNLVSNAFKHTFHGVIEVRLRAIGDTVRLEVSDTGIGIPDDQLPHLFGRFHRVDGARSRSHEGSGVGLSLVHELVELHQGSVWVESEFGVGSTFTVEIPASDGVQPSPDRTHDESRPTRSRSLAAHLAEVEQWLDADPVVDRTQGTTAGTVLVVDDNADMRSYLARLLGSRFAVVTAVDGQDALDQVQASNPDVIVSDVMMPRVDGLELVRQLRAQTSTADIPVILLSARAGPEASVEGLDLGADDYLVKPFSGEELIGRITARLATSRERRRTRLMAGLDEDARDLADFDDLAAALHRVAAGSLGADQASLAVRDGNLVRNHFSPALAHGFDARYHVVDEDAEGPLTVASRTGSVIVVESALDHADSFPDFAEVFQHSSIGAGITVPLRNRIGELTGAVMVAWTLPQRIDEGVVRLVEGLGEVVARSVDRILATRNESLVAEQIQGTFLELDARPFRGVVAARYRASDSALVVGGDWYDTVAIGEDRIGIAVGDVVGSGLPAALVMGQLRSALSAAGATGAPPGEVIDMVDAFARRIPGAHCTTAAYCLVERLDEDRAQLHWTSAGHPPPILADGDDVTLLWGGRRAPLGVGASGPAPSGAMPISAGSLVVLYTDGLVERRDVPIDDRLEQLRTAVASHRTLPVGDLCDRIIAEMAPDGAMTDDLAVVAVRLAGTTPTSFVDTIPADTGAIAGSRRRLRTWLEDVGLTPDRVDDVLLAVGEAVANAVEHGSRRRANCRVSVEIHLGETTMLAAVNDSGQWDRDASQSARERRGRGFRIMHALADDVLVDRGPLGSTVTLRLRRTQ